jgi:hypothetical protein
MVFKEKMSNLEKTKRCTKCKKLRPISDFHKCSWTKDGVRCYCKKCQNEINRNYYWKNRENELNRSRDYRKKHKTVIKKRGKIWRKKIRLETFTHYGGNPPKCACCGETNVLFLTIDHINNNGNRERQKVKRFGGWGFYAWLKKNNFPEGYQILCFNCNMGRARNNGVCPHK